MRSGRRTSPVWGKLEKKIIESLEKSSELREKDSELQSTLNELGKACQLVEEAQAERDRERAAFQDKKEDLLSDLK